jgi:hypothetical protein
MCTEEDMKLYDREMTYHEKENGLGGSLGTITVLWKGEDRYVGWSRCHDKMDQFNRKIGRKIALGRALHALKEDNDLVAIRRFGNRESHVDCYKKLDLSDPRIQVGSDCGVSLYIVPEFMYRQIKKVKKEG